MAEFDAISRHLIQNYPDEFAGFTLGREDVEVLEVIDTAQPTVSASQADSLIRVRIDGREALVHNEFQTAESSQQKAANGGQPSAISFKQNQESNSTSKSPQIPCLRRVPFEATKRNQKSPLGVGPATGIARTPSQDAHNPLA